MDDARYQHALRAWMRDEWFRRAYGLHVVEQPNPLRVSVEDRLRARGDRFVLSRLKRMRRDAR